MPISTKDYKKATSAASSLLDKLNNSEPPILIKEATKFYQVDIVAFNLGDSVSGVLISKGNIATIGYNPADPEVRQRFTIAHELGHFLMHTNSDTEQVFVDKDFIVKYRSTYEYAPAEYLQEQQANIFAAAVLMPEKLILKELRKEIYKDLSEMELISTLAKIFKVSTIAMTYRLANLNITL